jgi:hypothetical protein
MKSGKTVEGSGRGLIRITILFGLECIRETMKKINEDSGSPGRGLNRRPPTYETGMLTNPLRPLLFMFSNSLR